MMKKDVAEKLAALITTAFGLVAALAWNDAIKALMASMGLAGAGPWIYAIVVTVIAVFVAIQMGKMAENAS